MRGEDEEITLMKKVIETALNELQPELLLKDCNLVNVHSREITKTDISIAAGRVASIEKSQASPKRVIDCSDYYAIPGLIDGHIHLDAMLLTPTQLAKILLPCGTTTALIDPMEIGNVLGVRGIRSLLEDAMGTPLKVYVQVPSRVPTAPKLETSGAVIGEKEVALMIKWDNAVSLGEMDPSKIIPPRDKYLSEILTAKKARKVRSGHIVGFTGANLNAYAAAGLADDHECVTAQEALERIRLGMKILIKEGSIEKNLANIIKLMTEGGQDPHNFLFCTDDKSPNDIAEEGHIDHNVRRAIELGLDPIRAIQIATVNCAEHFRLEDDIGSIAPGRIADIILVRDLKEFRPEIVIANGEVVAKDGKLVMQLRDYEWPSWSMDTIKLKRKLVPADFDIPSDKDVQAVRVIQIIEDQIINKEVKKELKVVKGKIKASTQKDVLKIACVERHKGLGTLRWLS